MADGRARTSRAHASRDQVSLLTRLRVPIAWAVAVRRLRALCRGGGAHRGAGQRARGRARGAQH
eukprot:6200211-Pleurochrysis_carterae.AAC.6